MFVRSPSSGSHRRELETWSGRVHGRGSEPSLGRIRSGVDCNSSRARRNDAYKTNRDSSKTKSCSWCNDGSRSHRRRTSVSWSHRSYLRTLRRRRWRWTSKVWSLL